MQMFRISFHCPAERKIRKRCFLIFIVYVACVTTMVVFIMFGWFSGSFRRKVASLFKYRDSVNSTSEIQHNITRNSTADAFIE